MLVRLQRTAPAASPRRFWYGIWRAAASPVPSPPQNPDPGQDGEDLSGSGRLHSRWAGVFRGAEAELRAYHVGLSIDPSVGYLESYYASVPAGRGRNLYDTFPYAPTCCPSDAAAASRRAESSPPPYTRGFRSRRQLRAARKHHMELSARIFLRPWRFIWTLELPKRQDGPRGEGCRAVTS